MLKRARLFDLSAKWRRRFRLNESGLTLMEIVTTAAIAGVVMLGLGTVFSDMFTLQKRATTTNAIMQLRSSIITAAAGTSSNPLNPSAWQRTIADTSEESGNGTALNCLRENQLCPNMDPANKAAYIRLNLKQRDGSELVYSRIPTRGFTIEGRSCNTFSAVSGDPNCPFRYELLLKTTCTDGSSTGTAISTKPNCLSPLVEIDGDLLYSPGPTNILGHQINPDLYKIRVRRGEGVTTNIPVIISNVIAGTAGEGACSPGGVARRFNRISDPSLLKSIVGADFFTLQPGKYECRIEVPAFHTGQNTVLFTVQGGAPVAVGKAFAADNSGSISISLQASLVLQVATNFQVIHQCTGSPATNTYSPAQAFPNWGMGVPVPLPVTGYNEVTYTVVNCMKTAEL